MEEEVGELGGVEGDGSQSGCEKKNLFSINQQKAKTKQKPLLSELTSTDLTDVCTLWTCRQGTLCQVSSCVAQKD